MTANVTSHDAEGSTLTTAYQWTRNGTDISGATGSTLNLATAGNGDRGDLITRPRHGQRRHAYQRPRDLEPGDGGQHGSDGDRTSPAPARPTPPPR